MNSIAALNDLKQKWETKFGKESLLDTHHLTLKPTSEHIDTPYRVPPVRRLIDAPTEMCMDKESCEKEIAEYSRCAVVYSVQKPHAKSTMDKGVKVVAEVAKDAEVVRETNVEQGADDITRDPPCQLLPPLNNLTTSAVNQQVDLQEDINYNQISSPSSKSGGLELDGRDKELVIYNQLEALAQIADDDHDNAGPKSKSSPYNGAP
ncbi:UNVERIFIED_CONTAM: hypothetical protein Slati_4269500 [Sesamum latifolium]|uniref:Uncharacterized protein n=1 Tax=Sesamum latifolium TaxID=2727402 RepID=A0AAW2TCD0_9LAMI